ncbi:hypothetical protein [uncultured Enterovirga sp.]|uniref:hypothetical protein n=1 Tax=uncultured Enterovirga sp. TaxID=2026352 RepID=UPI0035CBA7B5
MRLLPIIVAAACLASAAATGQTAPSGVDARSPSTAGPTPSPVGGAGRNVTATGQTKPPGAAVAPNAPIDNRSGLTPELDRKSRELDRQISKGICKGC